MNLKDRAKELLKDLISIKSVSGKEREVQEFVERILYSNGIRLKRQYVEGDRFNLIYRGKKQVLISCHVDTVPPLGMREAFRPRERDGRIHGRGASDVKGALASLITAVEAFTQKYPGEELPVSLAFVVDEENNTALGSQYAPFLLGDNMDCLVLEPAYGMVCTSQQGALEFSIRVEGEGAHGAEFESVDNPVKVCMNAVRALEEKLNRPVNVIYIKGGSKHYVVPRRCSALLEVKLFEGERWEEVEEKIKEVLKKVEGTCGIEYKLEDAEEFIRFREGKLKDAVMDILRELNQREPEEGSMPSWTDAANYHRAGYRCLVFGYGSLRDSHTERESIGEDELEKMALFFLKLFERLR